MKECYVCCWIRDDESKAKNGKVTSKTSAMISFSKGASRVAILPINEIRKKTSDGIRKEVNELLDKCFEYAEEVSIKFRKESKQKSSKKKR